MNLSYHKFLNLGDIINVKNIVSSRNEALYDEITFLYKNIEFRESAYCCRTHYNKKYPNVFIGITKTADEEALTHELLHMKLYNLEFSSDYEDCTNGYKDIKDILINGERLVEDIANNLAHVRMLPYFLRLNYEESKFFSSICNHNVRIEVPTKKYCVTDSEFGFYFTEYIIAFVNLRFTRNLENLEQL